MRGWTRVLGALLGLSLAGCGDGTFIIAFNSGVIVGDPRCLGAGGQFDLRDEGGLVVLVVITSSTSIFVASGGRGACTDLSANAPVEVSGRQSGDRIVASAITIQPRRGFSRTKARALRRSWRAVKARALQFRDASLAVARTPL